MRPEHWLYIIPLRLRSLFRRRQVEQELNEELQFHLEQKIGQVTMVGELPVKFPKTLCFAASAPMLYATPRLHSLRSDN